MEWLASKGALVGIPVGHSPDVDLLAELDGRLLRVQVKTCTYRVAKPEGDSRWHVSLTTNGGNQSWSGAAKTFDPAKVDLLFVLVGDGRRWVVPAAEVEASRAIALGGAKYSEFEVAQGTAIDAVIYANGNTNKLRALTLGECQSGQMEQTVNLPAMPTEVRILSPPSPSRQVVLRPKRQATIPRLPCDEAGLEAGDRMRVRADGGGRVVFERIDDPGDAAAEPPA